MINLTVDKPMKGLDQKGEDCRPIFEKRRIGNSQYCLIAVCDGMGGKGSKQTTLDGYTNTQAHFASKKLREILIETFNELKNKSTDPIEDFEENLKENIKDGFSKLISNSNFSGLKGGMTSEYPTTLCAFVFNLENIKENKIFWAGDSRLYAIFEKQVIPLTEDHVDNPSIYPVVSKPLKRNIEKITPEKEKNKDDKYTFVTKIFNINHFFNYGDLLGFFVTTDGLIDGYQSPVELNYEFIKVLSQALKDNLTEFQNMLLNYKKADWSDDISVSLVLVNENVEQKIEALYQYFESNISVLYEDKQKKIELEKSLVELNVEIEEYQKEIDTYEKEIDDFQKEIDKIQLRNNELDLLISENEEIITRFYNEIFELKGFKMSNNQTDLFRLHSHKYVELRSQLTNFLKIEQDLLDIDDDISKTERNIESTKQILADKEEELKLYITDQDRYREKMHDNAKKDEFLLNDLKSIESNIDLIKNEADDETDIPGEIMIFGTYFEDLKQRINKLKERVETASENNQKIVQNIKEASDNIVRTNTEIQELKKNLNHLNQECQDHQTLKTSAINSKVEIEKLLKELIDDIQALEISIFNEHEKNLSEFINGYGIKHKIKVKNNQIVLNKDTIDDLLKYIDCLEELYLKNEKVDQHKKEKEKNTHQETEKSILLGSIKTTLKIIKHKLDPLINLIVDKKNEHNSVSQKISEQRDQKNKDYLASIPDLKDDSTPNSHPQIQNESEIRSEFKHDKHDINETTIKKGPKK
jgi:serine/threonine protein phosphatase PrpC